MIYLYSFLFCGIICLIGQLILEFTKLTPGHVTSMLVVTGAFLDIFGIYDMFISKFGAGALVPITSFGHSLIHGALNSALDDGILGLGIGMFNLTSAGIIAAIVFAFFLSLLFKPQN